MLAEFLKYQAQTTTQPMALEVKSAYGSTIETQEGKKYLDFVAGVSACTLGHCHPRVIEAITTQAERYLHVMVYGEFIQQPPLDLCKLLANNLPAPLHNTYLVNSGTEATEAAIKMARKVTGRIQILAAQNAYHGCTTGAMGIMGYEYRKRPFRPLMPGNQFVRFNNFEDIAKITIETAAVILETIQGGAGFICPQEGYLQAMREKCNETGTLLILDEIQTGMGRTGVLFGFENYGLVPDALIIGKGLGGGMPCGALIASRKHLQILNNNPSLGHITTFGGHPLVAAACLATLREVLETPLMLEVIEKEKLIRKRLQHPAIKEIRGKGLMLAIIFNSVIEAQTLINQCLKNGLILFGLLYEGRAARISPALNISLTELNTGCDIILGILQNNAVFGQK